MTETFHQIALSSEENLWILSQLSPAVIYFMTQKTKYTIG